MCFEGVLRVLQGRFKGLSFKFHGRGSLKDVSRVFHDFQGSFKSVSRSFKKTFNAFQKSLMLHGSHCSFPSRRRACFRNDRASKYKAILAIQGVKKMKMALFW